MSYFIVPARERPGAATQSMLIVDDQERTVKAFPFATGNFDAQMAAYEKADRYVDEVLLRKGPRP